MHRTGRKPLQLLPPYQVISVDTAADATFVPDPIEVVLVATLEVSIRDSQGEYLLVTSPRYETAGDTAPIESSHWNPPYVAQTIATPRVGWKNVGQVRQAIESAVSGGIPQVTQSGQPGPSWFPQTALEEIMATWACGLYEAQLIDTITEYKRSSSNSTVMKIYHVMRFGAKMSTCVHRALADPDSRKGFSFLPIDEERFATAVHERDCDRHGVRELVFVGKPLVSNLAHVVSNETKRDRLRGSAVEIGRDHFYAAHEGVLFCGDISNYGSACRYAQKEMQGIDIDGDDAGTLLRDLATSAITRIFHDAGISQVHTAGDGFIAAIPVESDEVAMQCIDRFLAAYGTFTALLDKVHARIAAHHAEAHGLGDQTSLGSRLAVHVGAYRYGKMAQAASLVTSFDGGAIIDVARLEQGLRAITKDADQASRVDIEGARHCVIMSKAAVARLGGQSKMPPRLTGGRETRAESKESVEVAYVFEFVGGESPVQRVV
jgi:hypothetical protein